MIAAYLKAILWLALLLQPIVAELLYYEIPNPFKKPSSGYYAIKSYQSVVGRDGSRKSLEVDDYFSLKLGISYSLHKDRDNPSHPAYAIIGDGARGSTYIVRKPDQKDDKIECELDQQHQHGLVFPWQYQYDQDPDEEDAEQKKKRQRKGKRKKKNDKWSKKRFIYGVGAILLNAVDRKIVSQQVGDNSPYPSANLWRMNEGDLEVKLIFDKPDDHSHLSTAELISESTLGSIQLIRANAVNPNSASGGTSIVAQQTEHIFVKFFIDDFQDSELLLRIQKQLNRCRLQTRNHRTFPSLIKAISLSPDRMFNLEYFVRKYARLVESSGPKGSYDERRHRHNWDDEFHAEWFSFKRQAQVNIYESAPGLQVANSSVVDIFIKYFTKYPAKAPHSTEHYCMVERDGKVENCLVGVLDSTTDPHGPLMRRPLHFKQDDPKADQREMVGVLSGLGALVMNALEVPDKQFSLFTKTIQAVYDPLMPHERTEVNVDEWSFRNKKSGRSYHFFFTQPENEYEQHQVQDLVRVDVRDYISAEMSDSVPDSGQGDEMSEADLIVRYEITNFRTEVHEEELDFIFELADECKNAKRVQPKDSDPESDLDADEFGDQNYNDQQDDDLSSGDDGDDKRGQADGEDFEFSPDQMTETKPIPDFYEFLQGEGAYEATCTIERLPDGLGRAARGRIYLYEQVDLSADLAILSVSHESRDQAREAPNVRFFINYNSEVVFKVMAANKAKDRCQVLEDVDDWLRLLSSKLTYYRMSSLELARGRLDPHDSSRYSPRQTMLSNRLRLYGVGALWKMASESEFTWFKGALTKVYAEKDSGDRYKLVDWRVNDEADTDMALDFRFKWNIEKQHEKGHLPYENLKLNRIFVAHLLNSDDPDDSDSDADYSPEDELPATKFERVALNEIDIQPLSELNFELPSECKPLIDKINQKQEANADLQHRSVPSFFEFIKPTNSYHVIYRVRHTTNSHVRDKNELLISEHYDRSQNRGLITIGESNQMRQVFIDGEQRAIYLFMPSTSTCKRISSLKRLVEVSTYVYDDNLDFNLKKMWGVAALWIWLSSFKDVRSRVVHNFDDRGNKQTIYTYRVLTDEPTSEGKTKLSIEATFIERPRIEQNIWHLAAPKTKLEEPELQLSTIVVLVEDIGKNMMNVMHMTTIKADDWSLYAPSGWNLPRECNNLAPPAADEQVPPNQSSPPDSSGSQLPSLMSIIHATNKFYLRSEMLLTYPNSDQEHLLVMLDEWLYHGDLRIRTSSGLDLIVYCPTREYFDVSELYQCSSKHPQFDARSASQLQLAELWNPKANPDKFQFDDLSALLYSPVSLWRLAELHPQLVRLHNTLDIMGGNPDRTGDQRLDALEREMKQEVWRVSSPEGSLKKWTYDLYFEKMSLEDSSGRREWHILDKVEIHDLGIAGQQPERIISYQVANYRYTLANEQLMDMLLLPEGAGCQRSGQAIEELWKQNDEFVMNLDQPHELWYEASLELVDDTSKKVKGKSSKKLDKKVLPTLLGRYISSGPPRDQFPLEAFVHYTRVRYQDGRVESSKTVVDKASMMIYQVDRLTGNCRIGQQKDAVWQLDFPNGPNIETVSLDRDLFSALFLATSESQFHPINRYARQGFYINTYEKSFDQLKVIENSLGRVSVVRRFQYPMANHKPRVTDDGVNTMMHHSVSVEIILFGSQQRPTRVLRMSLGFSPIRQLDVLRHTNLLQCFNDGTPGWDKRLRSFAIDYEADKTDHTVADEEHFLNELLARTKLSPLQLVGPPHFDFGPNHLMRVHFKLLEGLTAYEYFVKIYQSRMSDQLASKAELKVVSKLDECSRWCDELGCTAMSYCSDRTCRVVTSNMLRERRDNGVLCPVDLDQLSSSQPDPECMYFYTLRPQARTLDKIVYTLDTTINTLRPQFELQSLGYKIDLPNMLLPIAFKEFLDDTESAQTGQCSANNDTQETPVESLVLYSIGERLDLAKLELAKPEDVTGQLTHTQGQTECLEQCLKFETDCQLVSFCKSTSECVVVSGRAEIKTITNQLHSQQSGCTVFAKDYRLAYTRFDETRLPPKSALRLDGYSKLECASFCQLQMANEQENSINCLSFDHCTPKTGEAPVCFIQQDHLIMDSFDFSLLSPTYYDSNGAKQMLDGKEVTCEHYSKSVMADYRRLAHKSFITGISQQPLIGGSSVEKCALDCEQDEQCVAFEYCFNDRKDPPKSCLYLMTSDLRNRSLSSLKEIDLILKPSDFCSVHTLIHENEEFQVNKDSKALVLFNPSQVIAQHRETIVGFATVSCFIIGSLLLAAVLQFVYIRFFGRPLIFRY